MQTWLPLVMNALPLLAPFVLEGLDWIAGAIGRTIPTTAKPGINAVLAALIAAGGGTDPTVGAVMAHVLRSGLEHEAPAPAPAPTAPPAS